MLSLYACNVLIIKLYWGIVELLDICVVIVGCCRKNNLPDIPSFIFFCIFVENIFVMIPFDKIALIGSGNVSFTLFKALRNSGINPDRILIRNNGKKHEIENAYGVEVVTDYKYVLDCDLVIIAVNDDAIKDVARNLDNHKGLVVHTSGTQSAGLLNNVENYGVLYPLQTLTKDFDVDFRKVPLLINASSSDSLLKLRVLANSVSDIVVECSDEERSHIHMSAVYVSNFVNVMLQIGNKLLNDRGLDISLLESLVKETVNKAFVLGPENALTGPAKRGDVDTIRKHISMLENSLEERKIYELLTNYILKKYNKNEEL